MKSLLHTAAWSALSFLLVTLVTAAMSIYYFDVYERTWGSDGSFRVLGALVVFISLIVGVLTAFGLSFSGRSTFPKPARTGVLLGACSSACVTLFLVFGSNPLEADVLMPVLGFTVLVVGLAIVIGKRDGTDAS